ncbi:hypothetical protein L0B53_06000 [Vibrio sp. SS-MA-C1-2]|uniref:hypothetical protein n=1 Tax=Vibrio sp. SS-MA-C1-2 TaxID=2908646 RepID=UPI001F3B3DAE|nr:hypothetical protein [Vibrio sp. SS-MA-C1-2]UJF19129.1 hypothetical protein L0B53_06000 [Vibrio sp. SS-MA-C1-2]
MKRRFLYLEEIEPTVGLNQYDIQDAVLRGKLRFSALINESSLGAYFSDNNEKKIGATFDYNGIIRLSNQDSKYYVQKNNPLTIRTFVIQEPENILNWQSITEQFGINPLTKLQLTHNSSVVPQKEFLATSSIQFGQNNIQKTKNHVVNFFSMCKQFDAMRDAKVHPDFVRDDKDYVYQEPLHLKCDQIRIDIAELRAVFNIPKATKQFVNGDVESIETNPIIQIIERVLISYPDINAPKAWNLLRKDFNFQAKELDIDLVIYDMNADFITYFGSGDAVITQKKSTFSNHISRIRKKLNS